MKDERVHTTYSSSRLLSPGMTENFIGKLRRANNSSHPHEALTSCWNSAHRGTSGLPSSIFTITKVRTDSCSMAPGVYVYSSYPFVLEAAHKKCNNKEACSFITTNTNCVTEILYEPSTVPAIRQRLPNRRTTVPVSNSTPYSSTKLCSGNQVHNADVHIGSRNWFC